MPEVTQATKITVYLRPSWWWSCRFSKALGLFLCASGIRLYIFFPQSKISSPAFKTQHPTKGQILCHLCSQLVEICFFFFITIQAVSYLINITGKYLVSFLLRLPQFKPPSILKTTRQRSFPICYLQESYSKWAPSNAVFFSYTSLSPNHPLFH